MCIVRCFHMFLIDSIWPWVNKYGAIRTPQKMVIVSGRAHFWGIKNLAPQRNINTVNPRSTQCVVYFRSTPHPVTVTSRIITFLVGNPYKPSFATVTGWGRSKVYLPTFTTLNYRHVHWNVALNRPALLSAFWKFNSLPLKIYQNPKGKANAFQPSLFRGYDRFSQCNRYLKHQLTLSPGKILAFRHLPLCRRVYLARKNRNFLALKLSDQVVKFTKFYGRFFGRKFDVNLSRPPIDA